MVAAVMQTFKGHVRTMLRHAAASAIIEYAYNDKAVLAQRLMLTEELYGNTFTVCKVCLHTHTLSNIFAHSHISHIINRLNIYPHVSSHQCVTPLRKW